MYKIGICDDGRQTCAALEGMILDYIEEKELKAETMIWYTGESLCDYFMQGKHLDILFLDIELFQLNGIGVGVFIRNQLKDRRMQIIYISSKTSYARDLFQTQPMDFLEKPICQEQVNRACDLAVELLGKSASRFEFQNGRDYYYIPYGEILYFTSEGRKIRIVTLHGEKEYYGKLKALVGTLPGDFLFIHQSYIVNKTHVQRYTYELVELVNGTVLTISRVYRKRVREIILHKG